HEGAGDRRADRRRVQGRRGRALAADGRDAGRAAPAAVPAGRVRGRRRRRGHKDTRDGRERGPRQTEGYSSVCPVFLSLSSLVSLWSFLPPSLLERLLQLV